MARYGRHVGEVTAPRCGHLRKLAVRYCVIRDVTTSNVTSRTHITTSPRAPDACSGLLFIGAQTLFFFLFFNPFFLLFLKK